MLFENSSAQLQEIRRIRDPGNYNIVFMGDSWVGDGHVSNNIFEEAMKTAMEFKPLLVFHGGDIVFSGAIDTQTGRNPFQFFINTVNRLNTDSDGNRVPVFVTPGNHELAPTPSGPWSLENYRQFIGPTDIHYKLDLPEFHFSLIALNTLYHNVYQEYGLTPEELKFLQANMLIRNRNTFVGMHVPPREPAFDWLGSDAFPNGRGREEFYRLTKGKVSEVLVSHIHDFQLATKWFWEGFRCPFISKLRFILSGGSGATLNVGALNHIVVINIRNYGGKSLIISEMVPVGWTRTTVE